jgi:hypothetical protein
MKDSHYSLISRLLFVVAALLFVIAVVDWMISWFGYYLTWVPYEPGRLLEFAAILAIFVVTLLLRQIRDALKTR